MYCGPICPTDSTAGANIKRILHIYRTIVKAVLRFCILQTINVLNAAKRRLVTTFLITTLPLVVQHAKIKQTLWGFRTGRKDKDN